MTAENPETSENLGRLDDEAEEHEPSSTTEGAAAEGAAAEGDYDPAQGSPDSGTHAPNFSGDTES
jgi:hypothetical protein